MKLLLLFLLTLGFTSFAEARLHETFEQCVARYGKPVFNVDPVNAQIFEKSGIRLAIRFNEEGRADYIIVLKLAEAHRSILEEDEARALAKINLGDAIIEEEQVGGLTWKSSEHTDVAGFKRFERTLVICSVSGRERWNADNAASASEKLEGF